VNRGTRGYSGGSAGQYDPVRRRGALALIVGAVVAVVVLVALFSLLGGDDESGVAPTVQSTTASNPAAGGSETTAVITAESTDQERESARAEAAETGSGGEDSGEGQQDEGDPGQPAQGTPVSESDSGGGPETAPDGDVQPPGAGSPSAPGEGSRSEGSEFGSNEPGVFDPAGKDPEPGELTETDRQRVGFTVQKFINAAYGYTGDDVTEYVRGIERNVIFDDFYESPGGGEIKTYVEAVRESGVSAAASLERFEITETNPGDVHGTAYFVVGESYGEQGGVEGETTQFRQRIRLVPEGEVFKVRWISVEEEIG